MYKHIYQQHKFGNSSQDHQHVFQNPKKWICNEPRVYTFLLIKYLFPHFENTAIMFNNHLTIVKNLLASRLRRFAWNWTQGKKIWLWDCMRSALTQCVAPLLFYTGWWGPTHSAPLVRSAPSLRVARTSSPVHSFENHDFGPQLHHFDFCLENLCKWMVFHGLYVKKNIS